MSPRRACSYATVATGYKAGGFFPSVPAPNNSFAPEKLTAFTLGSRNRFLDRRLQLNAEAFYWDYKDKQERFLGIASGGSTGLLTTNAGAGEAVRPESRSAVQADDRTTRCAQAWSTCTRVTRRLRLHRL